MRHNVKDCFASLPMLLAGEPILLRGYEIKKNSFNPSVSEEQPPVSQH